MSPPSRSPHGPGIDFRPSAQFPLPVSDLDIILNRAPLGRLQITRSNEVTGANGQAFLVPRVTEHDVGLFVGDSAGDGSGSGVNKAGNCGYVYAPGGSCDLTLRENWWAGYKLALSIAQSQTQNSDTSLIEQYLGSLLNVHLWRVEQKPDRRELSRFYFVLEFWCRGVLGLKFVFPHLMTVLRKLVEWRRIQNQIRIELQTADERGTGSEQLQQRQNGQQQNQIQMLVGTDAHLDNILHWVFSLLNPSYNVLGDDMPSVAEAVGGMPSPVEYDNGDEESEREPRFFPAWWGESLLLEKSAKPGEVVAMFGMLGREDGQEAQESDSELKTHVALLRELWTLASELAGRSRASNENNDIARSVAEFLERVWSSNCGRSNYGETSGMSGTVSATPDPEEPVLTLTLQQAVPGDGPGPVDAQLQAAPSPVESAQDPIQQTGQQHLVTVTDHVTPVQVTDPASPSGPQIGSEPQPPEAQNQAQQQPADDLNGPNELHRIAAPFETIRLTCGHRIPIGPRAEDRNARYRTVPEKTGPRGNLRLLPQQRNVFVMMQEQMEAESEKKRKAEEMVENPPQAEGEAETDGSEQRIGKKRIRGKSTVDSRGRLVRRTGELRG